MQPVRPATLFLSDNACGISNKVESISESRTISITETTTSTGLRESGCSEGAAFGVTSCSSYSLQSTATKSINSVNVDDREESAVFAVSPVFQHLIKGMKPGIRYLYLIPREYVFLYFQDPCKIFKGKSPDQYEDKEPGCTQAWCRCMIFMLEELKSRRIKSESLLTAELYLKFNEILSTNVSGMVAEHQPGKVRSSFIRFGDSSYTNKGISEAIHFKDKIERRYEHCRGTKNKSFGLSVGNKARLLSDNVLLKQPVIKQEAIYPWGQNIELENIYFHPVAPNSVIINKVETYDYMDKLFQNELGSALQEIISALNNELEALIMKAKNDKRRCLLLVNIMGEYLPMLQQLHAPLDGTGRTNQMLLLYVFSFLDLPPVLLIDPNVTCLVHKKRCAQILQAGISNTLRLINERSPLRNYGDLMPSDDIVDKKSERHQAYRLPEDIRLSEEFKVQALRLTSLLTNALDLLPVTMSDTGDSFSDDPLIGCGH